MSKIEKLSDIIALKIKEENDLSEERYFVIKYGLQAVFQVTFSILTVVVFGSIFKVALEAFLISLIISILRRSAGGVHASTELNCALIGAVVSVFPAILIMNINMGRELEIVILIILDPNLIAPPPAPLPVLLIKVQPIIFELTPLRHDIAAADLATLFMKVQLSIVPLPTNPTAAQASFGSS